jgi:phosphohistidine phosphatase
MKKILILRHAQFSRINPTFKDHQHPLNDQGISDAKKIGKFLIKHSLLPDIIFHSSATRASQTTELLIEASGFTGPFEKRDDLYHTDPPQILSLFKQLPEEYSSILLIAHNPTLEALITDLTNAYERLSPGSLAIIEVKTNTWKEIKNSPSALIKMQHV